MPNPNGTPTTAQDTEPSHDAPRLRRKRRGSSSARRCGPVRPGRFFRKYHHLAWIRYDMPAFELGEADWLLYRRRSNPYGLLTYRNAAYERGFLVSKKLLPKPSWPPL